MQNLAIKAAGLKGTYLQTAAEMSKADFVKVEKETITIDLDMLEMMKKIPPELDIKYVGCDDGILKLRFHI
jgi:hypothetical protein